MVIPNSRFTYNQYCVHCAVSVIEIGAILCCVVSFFKTIERLIV